MNTTLSTSSLRPSDRAEFWRDAVSRTFIPLDVVLHEREPTVATITSHRFGPLQVSAVAAGPQTVVRDRRMIARDGESHLTLTIQHRGTARLVQDRREVFLGPGQFALSDASRPFEKVLPGTFGLTAFHLPRTALDVGDRELRALTATVFSPGGGCADVVASYLGSLARSAAGLAPESAHQLGLTACDLLATLLREQHGRLAPEAPEAARAMLVRVRSFTLEHLADPCLSPQMIAAAHHISVRYLHKLFESEDTTLTKWIRSRRLAMCRRDLARLPVRGANVAAVAQRWGFVSPAHFSRVFRAAYGLSPREWQEAALAGGRARSTAGAGSQPRPAIDCSRSR
ncbi:AraC-like ligand-binding domain-containing protein [Streptomyces lincolnensis]|uniref:AraC-like ligand-binding domain-containing protein n=1 Tax=Streptomyces lincolnensis TaxID=1915 RepID=UPI0037D889B2